MYKSLKRSEAHFSASKLNDKFSGHKSSHTISKNTSQRISTGKTDFKKWEDAARELNSKLQVASVVEIRNFSHKFLSCFGKSNYVNMQPQLPIRKQFFSKQKNQSRSSKRPLTHHLRKFHRDLKPHQQEIEKPKNKREGYEEMFEVKKCEGPLQKIGTNMQYEAKLTKIHIENIREVKNIQRVAIPIGFCIKDRRENFSANMISNHQQIPICVSLYSEHFDVKQHVSTMKREEYFQDMLDQMNGTYDPEKMSRMPLVKFIFRTYDKHKYRKMLQNFKFSLNMKTIKYLDNLLKLFFQKNEQKISQQFVLKIEKQVKENYKEGNQMSCLDYYLKFPFLRSGITKQYLIGKKEYISSDRIIYHGGYSKTLYSSWHKYIITSKAKLAKKIEKYDELIQEINGWSQQFQSLSFVETCFIELLGKSIKIGDLKRIQQERIKETFLLLKQIWIKGVLTLLMKNCFLEFCKNQYKQLLQPDFKRMKQFMKTNSRGKENTISEDIALYINYLESLHIFKFIKNYNELPRRKTERREKFKHLQIHATNKINNKNLQIYLNIQYAEITRKSVNQLMDLLINTEKPLINLSLKVERQAIHLEESKEKVMETIKQIYCQVTKKSLKFYTISPIPNEISPSEISKIYPEFGNIKVMRLKEYCKSIEMLENQGFVNKIRKNIIKEAQEGYEFYLKYKYDSIHEEDLRKVFQKIQCNYMQSERMIDKFHEFMPFIKLTAMDKFFPKHLHGQSYSEQEIFLQNMSTITMFKKKLSEVPESQAIGIFEINSEEPIKLLRERMNEIEYLIQQKYLNKIYEQIHNLEQELATHITFIHSIKIKANNIDEIFQKYQVTLGKLKEIKKKTGSLASKVYFYVEKQPKSETIVIRYHQLIRKREDLQYEVKKLIKQLNNHESILQQEIQEQGVKIQSKIKALKEEALQLCHIYFDVSKLSDFLFRLTQMKQQIEDFEESIVFYEESTHKFSSDGQKQSEIYYNVKKQFQIMHEFWVSFQTFFAEKKFNNIRHAKEMNLENLKKILSHSEQYCELFSKLKIFRPQNKIQLQYEKKFEEDLKRHIKYLPVLEVLVNKKIEDKDYDKFECPVLKGIFLKDLLLIENYEVYLPNLLEMSRRVNSEHEIYDLFNKMKETVRSFQIQVIDMNGNDTLNEEYMEGLILEMYNFRIDCQRLRKKPYSEKHEADILQFQNSMEDCQEIMKRWLQLESKFNEFSQFYCVNEDGPFREFYNSILEMHRRMMKSFDLDNSVWVIPKNKLLTQLLQSVNSGIRKLEAKLFAYFDELRMEYPRYYLLNNEELLLMMSDIKNMKIFLVKCLPTIKTIHVKDNSIDRIGGWLLATEKPKIQSLSLKYKKIPEKIQGNYIIFKEPLQVGARLASAHIWVQKLFSKITRELKYAYINSNNSENQNSPLQIQLLKDLVQFTEDFEYLLKNEESSKQSELEAFEDTLNLKIEDSKRDIKNFKDEILLLNSLLCREIVHSFMKLENINENCYQWLKIPKFYVQNNDYQIRPHLLTVQMVILNKSYNYGFNFIEQCYFTIQDHLFYGNYLVGKQCGKKSVVLHYAYLAGQQVLVYEYEERRKVDKITDLQNHFKINSFTGNWLLIPEVDKMSLSQLTIIAEYLITIRQTLEQNNQKMKFLNNENLCFNKTVEVFLTAESLHHEMPSRLVHNIRPIWLVRPDQRYFLNIYTQCKLGKRLLKDSSKISLKMVAQIMKNITYPKISQKMIKICDFLYFTHYHDQLSLWFLEFIKNYDADSRKNVSEEKFMNRLLKNKLFSQNIFNFKVNQPKHYSQVEPKHKILYSTQMSFNEIDVQFLEDEKITKIMIYQSKAWKLFDIIKFIKVKIKKETLNIVLIKVFEENLFSFYKEFENHFKQQKIKFRYLRPMKFFQFKDDIETRVKYDIQTIVEENKFESGESEKNLQCLMYFVENILKESSLTSKNEIKIQIIMYQLEQKYLIEKYSSRILINIKIQFLNLVQIMEKKGYKRMVAIVFSLAWIYGNWICKEGIYQIVKKFDLLKNLILFDGKVDDNLRNLYPVEDGFEKSQNLHKLKIQNKVIKFKCPLLDSIKLIKEFYKENFIIISPEYLSLILQNIECSEESLHLKEENTKNEQEIMNFLTVGTSKSDFTTWKYCSVQEIIIHNIERWEKETQEFLSNLADQNLALFKKQQKLQHFQLLNCRFVLGKNSCDKQKMKEIFIELNQDDLESIQKSFLQIIWEQNLKIDCSQLYMLEVMNSLKKKYSGKDQYYWFNQPILITIRSIFDGSINSLTGFFKEYMNLVTISLPFQEQKILTETYSTTQANEVILSIVKKVELLRRQEEYRLKKKICEVLLDNSEGDTSQINTIRISEYVYEFLIKTARSIPKNHLVLLGQRFTQREQILKITADILDMKLLKYFEGIFEEIENIEEVKKKNLMVSIRMQNLTSEIIKKVEEFSKKKFFVNRKIVIVLTLDLNSEVTKSIFRKYQFLKTHFISIVFPDNCFENDKIYNAVDLKKTLDQLENEKQIAKLQFNNKSPLIVNQFKYNKIIDEVLVKFNQKQSFKFHFILAFKEIQMKEHLMYEFYRRLIEQLFQDSMNFDEELKDFPEQFEKCQKDLKILVQEKAQTEEEKQEISKSKEIISDELKTLIETYETHEKELQKNTHDMKVELEDILKKLQKLERKIDSLSLLEISKLKYQKNVEFSNNIIQCLTTILKGEIENEKHIPIQSLKKIRKNQNFIDQFKDPIRKIATFLRNNEEKKKIVKLGTIFKIISDWFIVIDDHNYIMVGQRKTKEKNFQLQTINKSLKQVIQLKKQQEIKLEQEIISLSKKITEYTLKEEEKRDEKKELLNRKNKIQQISTIINKKYKMKISEDLSEYFYEIPKKVFLATFQKLRFNEFKDYLFVSDNFVNSQIRFSQISECQFKYIDQIQFNIFQDYTDVIKFRSQHQIQGVTIEHVSIVLNLLKDKNPIYFVEDQNYLIRNTLINICLEDQDYCVINMPLMPIDILAKTINQRCKIEKKMLVVIENVCTEKLNLNLLKETIQTMRQDCSEKKNKIIFLFKQFSLNTKNQDLKNIIVGKVVVSLKFWLKDFLQIMLKVPKFEQWKILQFFNDYNISLKKIFSGVERIKISNINKNYEKILQTLETLENRKTEGNLWMEQFQKYKDAVLKILDTSIPLFLFYKTCEMIQKRSKICLFEIGSLYENWLASLIQISNEVSKKQKKNIDKKIMMKIMENLGDKMSFSDEFQVYRYLLFCVFALRVPENQFHMFNSLIPILSSIESEKDKFHRIIQEINVQSLKKQELQVKWVQQNFSTIFLCQPWVEAFILANTCTLKNKKKVLQKLRGWLSEPFLQKILYRTEAKDKSHYYLQIKDKQFLFEKKSKSNQDNGTSQSMKVEKILNIYQINQSKINNVLINLKSNISKMSSKIVSGSKLELIYYYFDYQQKKRSMSELKKLSEKKVHIYLINVNIKNVFQRKILDQLLFEISKHFKKHYMFRLIVFSEKLYSFDNKQLINILKFDDEDFHFLQSEKVIENGRTNSQVLNSLSKIVEKETHKLCHQIHKKLIYNQLLSHLSHPTLLNHEGNCTKFLVDYFKIKNLTIQKINKFIQLSNILKNEIKESDEIKEDKINKNTLIGFRGKISDAHLLHGYESILKTELNKKINLNGKNKTYMNIFDIINLIKYGSIEVQNYLLIKGLLYDAIKIKILASSDQDLTYKDMGDITLVLKLSLDGSEYLFNLKDICTCFEKYGGLEYEFKIYMTKVSINNDLVEKKEVEALLESFSMRFDISWYQNKDENYLGMLKLKYK